MKLDSRTIKTVAITGVLVGIVAWGVGYYMGRDAEYRHLDEQEMNTLTGRLGFGEDWESVRQHVYCDILVKGKPRQQVESELLQVDGYLRRVYGVESDVTYVFYNMIVDYRVGMPRVQYDSSWRVLNSGYFYEEPLNDVSELRPRPCNK